MNRQKMILFVLLIILALSSLYAFFSSTGDERALSGTTRSTSVSDRKVQSDQPGKNSALKVDLELLARDEEKYEGYKRDIFNFYQPKPKPAPVVKLPPKPVVTKPVVVATPAQVVTPQVRQQLASFTFLGFLIKDEERTVFLTKRDELYLVKKNDSFGENDQFLVSDITAEKLTISQQGISGLIEIPLIEKEPLIPSFSAREQGEKMSYPAVNMPGQPIDQNQSQVPQQEQRKRWFKTTTEPPGEEAVTQ